MRDGPGALRMSGPRATIGAPGEGRTVRAGTRPEQPEECPRG